MRGLVLALAATALTAVSNAAAAQTPPEGLVWMVLRDINDYGLDRDDPTNRPALVTRVPDGMIRPVDVTHDGHTDWLVDYEASGINGWCGTGGCTKIVYVSLGDDGLTRAFDEQAHSLTFYDVDGESRIGAQVHHALCSSDASRDCAFGYAWDTEARRLVERPNRAGEAVIPVGAFSPIDRSGDRGPPEAAPAPVADLWFKTRTTCPATYNDDGVDVRRADIHDVPDLDGDGVRDWVVEPPSPCQVRSGDTVPYPGFQVWLTRDGGEAVLAYTSPPDRYPHVDLSRSPAVVVTEPACGIDETCAATRLIWDPAVGRLVE